MITELKILPDELREELRKKFSEFSEIDIAIQEFERFFYLSFAISEFFNSEDSLPIDIPVSVEIDEIWHYCILQTKIYRRMCDSIVANSFLHHRSSSDIEFSKSPKRLAERSAAVGLSFLTSYTSNFGHFEKQSIRFWDFASKIMEDMNWSIDEINDFLSEIKNQPSAIHFSI